MGIVFALLCAIVAAVNGYYSEKLKTQGAELRRKGDTLRAQNNKLRKLERANRRATRFLVHDFKTPLGTILGFTDLLLSRDEFLRDEKARDALVRIRRQGAGMLDAARALIDLNRVREGEGLKKSALQVDRLLEGATDIQVCDVLASRVEFGRHVLTCPRVDADLQVIRRVVANLVSNAVKHNTGCTTVLLDAYLASNRSEVIIACTDDGNGIPEEFLPRLFKEYTTNGGKAGSDSVGLGLAFCREAVEAHGGRIWYEPRDRSGARICFTLPVAKEEVSNDE
jgi:signal transduction histidine kinase